MSLYQNLWFFFIYAVMGWCVEVLFSAFCGRGFVNRGFFYGPMCSIYGYTILVMVLLMDNVKENFVLLYFGCASIASFFELFVGWFSYTLLGEHLWDYSHQPFQLGGHICLTFCMIWGVLGSAVVLFLHPLVKKLVSLIPLYTGETLLSLILAAFLLDVMMTLIKYIQPVHPA